MAAIDPTAEANGDGPKRATLKIIRRPLSSSMYNMGDSDDDSDEESDDEDKPASKKAKKADRKEDSDSDDDSDNDEGLEIEEFVICTLDAERVWCHYSDFRI